MAAKSDTNIDESCVRAAKVLQEADVLLIVTGAGFSADSGLPIYNDIAQVPAYQNLGLEYSDICQPQMLEKDPELFYGFWGQCYTDYRNTRPHDGYSIVKEWRNRIVNKSAAVSKSIQQRMKEEFESQKSFDSEEIKRQTPYLIEDPTAQAAYVFTSNCDAHFYDYFPANEIHDCHGNIELWQCSNRDCEEGTSIWRAALDHSFVVDKSTMRAPQNKSYVSNDGSHSDAGKSDDKATPRIGQTIHSGKRDNTLQYMPPAVDSDAWVCDKGSNWPRCKQCESLARPAIFMFGDFGWEYDKSQEIRWDAWRSSVLDLCQNDLSIKVCIVEIGCGMRVSTCRTTSEDFVEDVIKTGSNATLVRINPDFPTAPEGSVSEHNCIAIESGALRAIQKIEKLWSSNSGK
mmetsp:Transcript_7162/g.11323  ORF Transcript_7162/g.11323 Transcript_7162/m.11323 type:complete len:402 (+) Transcript_7162:60-1265(+)